MSAAGLLGIFLAGTVNAASFEDLARGEWISNGWTLRVTDIQPVERDHGEQGTAAWAWSLVLSLGSVWAIGDNPELQDPVPVTSAKISPVHDTSLPSHFTGSLMKMSDDKIVWKDGNGNSWVLEQDKSEPNHIRWTGPGRPRQWKRMDRRLLTISVVVSEQIAWKTARDYVHSYAKSHVRDCARLYVRGYAKNYVRDSARAYIRDVARSARTNGSGLANANAHPLAANVITHALAKANDHALAEAAKVDAHALAKCYANPHALANDNVDARALASVNAPAEFAAAFANASKVVADVLANAAAEFDDVFANASAEFAYVFANARKEFADVFANVPAEFAANAAAEFAKEFANVPAEFMKAFVDASAKFAKAFVNRIGEQQKQAAAVEAAPAEVD